MRLGGEEGLIGDERGSVPTVRPLTKTSAPGGVSRTETSPICCRAMVRASVSIFRNRFTDGSFGDSSAVARCSAASTG